MIGAHTIILSWVFRSAMQKDMNASYPENRFSHLPLTGLENQDESG
jgi:hypothetical protein